ncbi:hypothetical protein FQA39_LY07456 [Lamprigera yunnana]|nr:hypothetical protein FQA39_LY07456 [Lamprigera yunnana]
MDFKDIDDLKVVEFIEFGLRRQIYKSLKHLKASTYNNPLAITESKLKHLQELNGVIEKDHHIFYDYLKFKADKKQLYLLLMYIENETDNTTPQLSTSSVVSDTSMKRPDVELLTHLKDYASKIMVLSQSLSDETDNITPQSSTSSVVTVTSKFECTAIISDDTPHKISLKRKICDLCFIDVVKNLKIRKL